jgi:ABC-2 type transport system ATP-binding protein
MADRVVFEHVALTSDGPTLALRLSAGQSLAVVGRAGSGKSRFLSMLGQNDFAVRGTVRRTGSISTHLPVELPRRAKLQSLAATAGNGANDRAAQALSAVGLWPERKSPLSDLSPGLRQAAMLLPALVSRDEIIVIDGLLDTLDPWTVHQVLALLQQRLGEGQTVCVATNRPDIAARMDVLVVLEKLHIRFAGSPNDLIRSAIVSRLEVHSESHAAVRALARPFEVTINQADGVTLLEAAEGQEIAAKLLLEGYGDVKFIVLTQPTIETALRALL